MKISHSFGSAFTHHNQWCLKLTETDQSSNDNNKQKTIHSIMTTQPPIGRDSAKKKKVIDFVVDNVSQE